MKNKNEIEFILFSSRINPTQNELERAIHFAQKVKNWEFVIYQFLKHGLAGVVLQNNTKKNNFNIPEKGIKKLQAFYYAKIADNQKKQRTLLKILNLFNKNNIKFILLKGMAMQLVYYKVPGLRPMSDIDALVEEKDLRKAEKLLIENGFYRRSDVVQKNGQEIILKNTTHHLKPFFDSDTHVMVEIHWSLINKRSSFYFDNALLVKHIQEIEFQQQKAYFFTPQMQAAHFYLHLFSNFKIKGIRISWLNDYRLYREQIHENTEIINFDKLKSLITRFEKLIDFYSANKNGEIDKFYPYLFNTDAKIDSKTSFLQNIKLSSNPFMTVYYSLQEIFPPFDYVFYKFRLKYKIQTIFYYPKIWLSVLLRLYRGLFKG